MRKLLFFFYFLQIMIILIFAPVLFDKKLSGVSFVKCYFNWSGEGFGQRSYVSVPIMSMGW